MSIQWFPGIVIFLLGLVVTVFGYRLLKFTLVVFGFGLGVYLGWLLGIRIGAVKWLVVLAGIGLGVLGALLTVWLFKVSVFLLGAVAGILLTLIISGATGWHQLLIVLVGALTGGILALLIQRPVLSLLTAFVGAWGMVAGVFSLFGKTRIRLGQGLEMPLLAILWLGLGGLGFLVQLLKTGKKKEKSG
ncbi:MAG: DUF4203 domain-containing protein [candidate division WOR-3 bacterium]